MRGLDHEGGAPMNKISALLTETPPQSLLTLSALRGHREKMASADTEAVFTFLGYLLYIGDQPNIPSWLFFFFFKYLFIFGRAGSSLLHSGFL